MTVPEQTQVLAGRPCPVDYTVEWQGARDAAIVLPLEVSQPDWGHAELKSTRTEHDGDRWRVVQVVEYTASKAGKYTVAPVEIQAITANQPIVGSFDSTPSTRVKAPETTITVFNPPNTRAWGGIVAAVVVVGAVGGLLYYRRKKRVLPGQEEDVVAVARELLHHARRNRLDGDLYACYQSMLKSAEALQTVNIEAKNVADSIRARIPAVGFQGVRPTDDEMDGLFRDLERIIARRNTAPTAEQEI